MTDCTCKATVRRETRVKRMPTSPPLVFLYVVLVILMFVFFGYIFVTGDVTGGLGGDYYEYYDYYYDDGTAAPPPQTAQPPGRENTNAGGAGR